MKTPRPGGYKGRKMEKMKMKIEIEKHHENYNYIGIRVQEEPFELGPIDHNSHVWIDGEDTGEELPGISAINAEKWQENKTHYYGDHIAIIGSNSITYGEDVDEIVMEDAEVLEVLS